MEPCLLNYLGGTFVIRPKTSRIFEIALGQLSSSDNLSVINSIFGETPSGLNRPLLFQRRNRRPFFKDRQLRPINWTRRRLLSTFRLFIKESMIFTAAFLDCRTSFTFSREIIRDEREIRRNSYSACKLLYNTQLIMQFTCIRIFIV